LLLCCYRYPPEPGYTLNEINSNNTNWLSIQQEELREVIGFVFIRMMLIILSKYSTLFPEYDTPDLMIGAPFVSRTGWLQLISHRMHA